MNSLAQVFAVRRAALLQRLAGSTAVFAAGALRYRNIPAIPCPFRASSHVLYFAGMLPAQSVLVVGERLTALFLPPNDFEDRVWSGVPEEAESIVARTGIQLILPLESLPNRLQALGLDSVVTIPSVDPASNQQLAELIGRVPTLQGADGELARIVGELRIVHDEFARSELAAAAAGTRDAFVSAIAATKPGLREYQIRARLLASVHNAGLHEAFVTGCSVHGEVIHNESQQGTLAEGDLLLVDFGAERPSGYSADVTRVWPVGGRFSPLQRAVYEVVLATQQAAISAVKPGVRFRDLHFLAARVMIDGLCELGLLKGDRSNLLERRAHTLFFPHGLGHLLGLDTHDLGDLGDIAGYPAGRSRSTEFGTKFLRLDRDLAEHMVVTIEPGWYWIPALLENDQVCQPFRDCLDSTRVAEFKQVRGIRIEDDVCVTAEGCTVVTAEIPKSIDALEALVGTEASAACALHFT